MWWKKQKRKPISGVYLSGWEYNRLLQEDPTVPRNSGLPASALWSGSHQLWMFREIRCTKEALANELAATERLGWAQGEILQELRNRDILHPIDWQRDLLEETKNALKDVKRAFDERPNDAPEPGGPVDTEGELRKAIKDRQDVSAMEGAKKAVLKPVLDQYGCIEFGTPNSITTWFDPGYSADEQVHAALRRLAQPVVPGFQSLRPPKDAISASELGRQKHVEQIVERPMIPDLLAGDGDFAGAYGYEEYLRRLVPHQSAYAPLNEAMRADWRERKSDLFRLRDAAETYVWPTLHGTYLPLLGSDDPEVREAAIKDLDKWIRAAVRIRRMARFLNAKPTRFAVGTLGPLALTSFLVSNGVVPLLATAISQGLRATARYSIGSDLEEAAKLGVFYQLGDSDHPR